MTWYPHVTVASIIENDGKFLFVEEVANGKRVINQPAGHLEAEETLIEAAQRETLEETQWQVAIDGVVGMGLYVAPGNGVTLLTGDTAANTDDQFRVAGFEVFPAAELVKNLFLGFLPD